MGAQEVAKFQAKEISGSELKDQSEEARRWTYLSAFKTAPFRIEYNENLLELRIRVPVELRKKNTTLSEAVT